MSQRISGATQVIAVLVRRRRFGRCHEGHELAEPTRAALGDRRMLEALRTKA